MNFDNRGDWEDEIDKHYEKSGCCANCGKWVDDMNVICGCFCSDNCASNY